MKKLRELRLMKNYTNQNMADIIGISKAYYWQLENKKRNLSYIMAVRIANVFQKKPDEIFYEEFKNQMKYFKKNLKTRLNK